MSNLVYKNQTTLKRGYTTGSCAAAAAQAATLLLLTGQLPEVIELHTPKGIDLFLHPEQAGFDGTVARCCIRKDSGDDPDVTNGICIYADVQKQAQEIVILGGDGVGVVTRPGLSVPVGQPAINPGPRAQITAAVTTAAQQAEYTGGLQITISAENGDQIAKQTYNEHLGIVGGISILGTSGIVEPMSEAALMDTTHLELDSLYAAGARKVLICPGNYGADFARDQLGLDLDQAVKCSNFIGDALDYAAWKGFQQIFLVGHAGKLVKIAAGVMNTHSSVADGRQEIFTAHAALCGAPHDTLQTLMQSVTIDACLEVLDKVNLRNPVLERIGKAIDERLHYRLRGKAEIGYLMFTNQSGVLAQSKNAVKLCEEFRGLL
ncbi:cobalt-precorrin-5B (C(1))-methyltransferase CbiD [Butyricicoccus pullicaecorum]|uniref:cobalt-precorrin-5B (C(1))-methyltransferase CbiD n=1 Tax=Butyricicoccus pullicaecorum TaxID=501571 RepID=UPI0035218BB4